MCRKAPSATERVLQLHRQRSLRVPLFLPRKGPIFKVWHDLSSNSNTLLSPLYLLDGTVELGYLESTPATDATFVYLQRRDLVTAQAAEEMSAIRGLRTTRLLRNQVELHLLAVRPDGGLVRIGFAVPGLDWHLLGSYFRNLLWLLIASLLAAAVLYLYLSIWLVRRIRLLESRFNDVEQGRMPQPLSAEGRDELARVFRGFNHMASELQRSNRLHRELAEEKQLRTADAAMHQAELDRTRIVSAEQRFAALGRISSGIAHEINNPLTFIRGAILPLQRKLVPLTDTLSAAQRAPILQLLETIAEGAERATQIITDMRQLTQGGETAYIVELQASVQQSLRLTQLQNREERHLEIEFPPDTVRVKASPGLLLQVWSNLLVNAIEATRQGDLIRIRITRLQPDSGSLDADDSCVWLRVDIEDSGSGWCSDTAGDPSEPFATTKTEGSGLGLAIARSIIEASGGSLEFGNSTLGGAQVTVWLPEITAALDDTR